MTKLILESKFKYRYYLNYCTYSYSMPWWDWERWEKEIDFMALNGVNLVLTLIGQEAVWQECLTKLGCDPKDIFEFLPGPAFLAWGWLNNLEGWGGPTTQNWIDNQKELQLKILKRLREFQITPILQAFTGRVPKVFTKLFSEAKITKLPGWYKYDGVYFLDPSDKLFDRINKMLIEIQSNLYGNDHYFAGDIFHEIDSSDKNNDSMSRIYKGIQDSLLNADPEATWILQSWTIRDDSISVLNPEHTLVLDMFCESEPKWEKTEYFHGQPWIWSIINNFGGRTGLGGPIKKINNDIQKTIENINTKNLLGIGVVPEGIENNPLVYELLWEANWQKIIDLNNWIKKYSHRRYGVISNNIEQAWIKLLETVYSGPDGYAPIESVICAAPSFNIKNVSSNGSIELYYSNAVLLEALELLLLDSDNINGAETYSHDIIDITRQFGANLSNEIYKIIIKKYFEKDKEEFIKYSEIFLNLLEDLDVILSCNKYFSLGYWLNAAKQKAVDDNDLKMLEWNARRQITLWSSPEITEFHDYANKQWSGLIKDYYIPRWKKFFDICKISLNTEKEINEDDFKNYLMRHAVEWSNKHEAYEDVEINKVAAELIKKFIINYKKYVSVE